ncbi:NifU family protein [Trujillonella endophytica]|uniref:NifU-like domain-containing protein n=1 Tax=Trujillonella endophytica TaxID=673521 RepID=A0A1H8Q4N2_9ACTN|nr:NifU family protein [Trujillella endophytica]SEO49205.1 NifU-like domain-containing protein [Trujillella endophytica]
MSAPDADARAVVAHFQRMLGSDGSVLEVRSLEGDTLTVEYRIGDCDTCELQPSDLAGMMEELLGRRGSTITKVSVAG